MARVKACCYFASGCFPCSKFFCLCFKVIFIDDGNQIKKEKKIRNDYYFNCNVVTTVLLVLEVCGTDCQELFLTRNMPLTNNLSAS